MQRSTTRLYALHALTPQGLALAQRIVPVLGNAAIYAKADLVAEISGATDAPDPHILDAETQAPAVLPQTFTSLTAHISTCFHNYDCHIFIAACGIAVRCIAPLLQSKSTDPAVLVLDQRGRFVISLLSGHLGGANAAAERVANILGATPVITTATDIEGLPALDCIAQQHNLAIADMRAVKRASAALLAGTTIPVYDPENRLHLRGTPNEQYFYFVDSDDEQAFIASCNVAAPGVCVTMHAPLVRPDHCLLLHPRCIHAGIGCRKGIAADEVIAFLLSTFAAHGLAIQSLATIHSIDAKCSERGLMEAASHFAVPFACFSAAQLAAFPVTTPSRAVQGLFGIDGVCEPSALAAASKAGQARLLLPKQSNGRITIALAL